MLSFWQIWNMTVCFLGIQYGFGLQQANMSPIYRYLGAAFPCADTSPINQTTSLSRFNMNVHQLLVALVLLLLCMSYAAPQEQTYQPNNKNPNGVELIAMYIGAEYCGPCHDPQLKKAIKKMKTILGDRAAKEGRSFSVTGVATDWGVETGIRYLRGIGPFDELIVGKGLFNQATSEYIWKDLSTSTIVPQIVVIERDVRYQDGRAIISNNRVIDRHLGTIEIISWVNKGAQLPNE